MNDLNNEKIQNDKYDITTWVLGHDIPISPNETSIIVDTGRLRKIENLDICKNLRCLKLIAQQIDEISGLSCVPLLEELELYQNKIKCIKNIDHLRNLRVLDLSFNSISKIENISTLSNLEEFYICSNNIKKIEGLTGLNKLRVLEMGSNKISKIENIDCLENLEELWLGRNKIISMNIPKLNNLKKLSLQSNRITIWNASLYENTTIEELYLSHNKLTDIPNEISQLIDLVVLDLGCNKIKYLDSLSKSIKLKELWVNDNDIIDLDSIKSISFLVNLETIYFERNPFQLNLGPAYKKTIVDLIPWLKQLDAILLECTYKINVDQDKEMAQKPLKIFKNSGKKSMERKNKPVQSSLGYKNSAIKKLRNVNKLVGVNLIEKTLTANAKNNNERLKIFK